jgi:peroxiredoxin
MAAILNPGVKAPDFTLGVAPDKKLTLSELRGKPVILAFYPADWSPVCGDQMALYNEVLPEFQAADFEPKGAVARSYGVYRDQEGFCERALFVIDKNGVITWSYCSPIQVNPGADGILEALEALEK